MNLRSFLAALVFCGLALPASSQQPTPSAQVRQRLEDALRAQAKSFFAQIIAKMPPANPVTAEQIDQQVDTLFTQAVARYGPGFTLADADAQAILTKGPNDADNSAVLKRNWETYKKVVLPLPVFMKYLHEQVEAGTIRAGWDLELARRVSDAHVTEATDAQRRYEESQKKKNP